MTPTHFLLENGDVVSRSELTNYSSFIGFGIESDPKDMMIARYRMFELKRLSSYRGWVRFDVKSNIGQEELTA